ncbi:MAG: hypothetical protein QXT45_06255 [Candidatus Bilamarchaeaceae archaeon]
MFVEGYQNPYPVVGIRKLMLPQYRVSLDDEGLGGFKIGKFFKKVGTSFGRVFSGGLWDPSKNRFFVPFSSGHMRTLGKGLVGTASLGLINADKFFDSRTMRTLGTVTGVAVGAVAGGAAVSAVTGTSIGSMIPSIGTLGKGLDIASKGFGLMQGFMGGGGSQEVPQPQVVEQQSVQTNYPTVVNPVSMYPYDGPVPYTYDPYGRQGEVVRSDDQLNIVQSPSWQESVLVKKESEYLLPGGVEVKTVEGLGEVVDVWGKRVRY